jgi:hypothetical protein
MVEGSLSRIILSQREVMKSSLLLIKQAHVPLIIQYLLTSIETTVTDRLKQSIQLVLQKH